jgi:hypothetical protein
VREAASSTHVTSFWFFVGTVVDLTVRFTLLVSVQDGHHASARVLRRYPNG